VSGTGWRSAATRLLLAGAGAAAVRLTLPTWRGRVATTSPEVWRRTNFRGATVSLAGGPALAAAASLTAAVGAPSPATAAAALTAGLGAGGVGLYDDLVGQRPQQRAAKGFHGHLAALQRGQVTSGVVKIAGVGAAGVLAAALLDQPPSLRRSWSSPRVSLGVSRKNSMINARLGHVLLGAGVIAGAANLINLLDLRPGRALKVGLLAGVSLTGGAAGGLAAGPVGACVGLLPDDLDERTMLGDGGANALGALLGVALVARTGTAGRAAALAVIAALTAASEKVSFTRVIAATPVLREIDNLGRRPDPAPDDR
jgi:UDP-N-acetylmuramyl pentapeptide phosphotransferase/UDP-N-acetylglucosamine-1-phosphate transferase